MAITCKLAALAAVAIGIAASDAANQSPSCATAQTVTVEMASCCSTSEPDADAASPTESAPPTTQKATESTDNATSKIAQTAAINSTVSISGAVTISGNWDLQKPDLTRAVVYLASDPVLDAQPFDAEFVTISQKNKSFVPNFAVIPRGMTVEFPNWDDFDHNVFSRSAAAPAFDLDRYPKGQSKSRVFEKTGVVQIFCNIHPQMRAMIMVTPNRYFARCDGDGRFRIDHVPPGRYEIVGWHERCAETRQTITVPDNGTVETSLTLAESRESIIANEPVKRDKSYGIERGLGIKREKLDLPVVKESHAARSEPPR